MSSVAVLSPSMSDDTMGRRSVSGVNRKSILAGIDASASRFGANLAQTEGVSNTDAVLRSRKTSDASSTNVAGSNTDSRLRSRSNASGNSGKRPSAFRRSTYGAQTPSKDSNYLTVDDKKSVRSGSLSFGSLRRKASNLSQKSANNNNDDGLIPDDRSVTSRKSSKSSIFTNLVRRRSRVGSTSGDVSTSPSSLEPDATTPSRIRSFSSTSRRMSLPKLGIGARRASVSSLSPNGLPAEGSDDLPPVPPVPDVHRASTVSDRLVANGYKPISPTAERDDFSASVRSRRFSRQSTPSANDPEFKDPFSQADGLLKRARSRSEGKGPRSARTSSSAAASQPDSNNEDDLDEADNLVSRSTPAANGVAIAPKTNGHAASAIEQDAQEEDELDSDYESSDDEFYDAELADILEGSEEEEEYNQRSENGSQGRRSHDGGVARTRSSERINRRREGGSTYKPKGTAAASRRAGGPAHSGNAGLLASSTAEQRSKGELPQAIRDKAARVAKLTAEQARLTPDQLQDDLNNARHALQLFLNSRMIEAEKLIEKESDRRLYYALGAALIATIKGFMTFEPQDLAIAISHCKDALTIAHLLRKPTSTVANFGRFVRGTGQSPSSMASMDVVQKHAELIYAECTMLKAILGIVYSGDFFGFVSEALNMRNAYGVYRSLYKYYEWAEEKGLANEMDEDFKSGVYLGNGLMSMILGLLPSKILKVMEVFGYTGDCAWALKTLSKAGGWSFDSSVKKPTVSIEDEGIRRPICEMSLLMYHLVISTFIPVNGVDISFADKVLHFNLKRYPEGVFFLYFSGRLYSTQALSEKAITQFEMARDVQKEYVQLKHICVWDLSLCHMAMCQWTQAHDSFAILAEENNWSKAVYNYGRASTLYESAHGQDTEVMKEAARFFAQVPNLTQKIAGKSIPMEKFVARKSKKFNKYKRLLLPGLEFSYVYHCLSNAPRYILADEALVLVSDALAELHAVEDPSRYYSGEEYFDDLALAHFLRGVCLKFIAYPEPHSKKRPKESPIPVEEAAEQAEISFNTVLEHGHKLKLDHWLVYFAHYELGRLYASRGEVSRAKEQFNLVLSQKNLEDRGRKGKYSLQNMVHLRSNGALNALEGI